MIHILIYFAHIFLPDKNALQAQIVLEKVQTSLLGVCSDKIVK